MAFVIITACYLSHDACDYLFGDILFHQDFNLTDFTETFDNLQLIHCGSLVAVPYSTCSDEINIIYYMPQSEYLCFRGS